MPKSLILTFIYLSHKPDKLAADLVTLHLGAFCSLFFFSVQEINTGCWTTCWFSFTLFFLPKGCMKAGQLLLLFMRLPSWETQWVLKLWLPQALKVLTFSRLPGKYRITGMSRSGFFNFCSSSQAKYSPITLKDVTIQPGMESHQSHDSSHLAFTDCRPFVTGQLLSATWVQNSGSPKYLVLDL